MGSLFKPKDAAPPPPAPPTLVRDEVNGVEQVPVTQPDGTTTYITRALPLTPDQQAQKAETDKILQDSLAEIKKLSATDYAADDATAKVLDQWTQRQNELLAKQTDSRAQQEEDTLARRGLADSAAAQAVRRQRVLDAQDAQKNVQLQRDDLGNQIRSDKLALQQNLYNLASSQKDAAATRTARAATSSLSDAVALNAQRQASILDYYNAQQRATSGGGLFSVFGNAAAGTLGRTVGGALGVTSGGGAGSLLGSWLFGRR